MSKTILFLDPTEPALWTKLTDMGYHCVDMKTADREVVLAALPNAFGIIIRSRLQIDQSFLDHTQELAFIARSGVGLEHVEVAYAESKGIKVINSPEGSRDTVGEHALGLLLMLMNNLSRADREVRQGKWIRGGNRGYEIKGKTVGIIGYGNMGKAFAQRLSGFDCKVIAYDKYEENYGNEHAKEVNLEELQKQADIVSLHIPYSAQNHHFVNEALINDFEKSFWIINTARGLVLKTDDLLQALESGKIRGAALDVNEYEDQSFAAFFPLEQPATFQRLMELPNVILNPHIAGWSYESEAGHARVLSEKIGELFGKF